MGHGRPISLGWRTAALGSTLPVIRPHGERQVSAQLGQPAGSRRTTETLHPSCRSCKVANSARQRERKGFPKLTGCYREPATRPRTLRIAKFEPGVKGKKARSSARNGPFSVAGDRRMYIRSDRNCVPAIGFGRAAWQGRRMPSFAELEAPLATLAELQHRGLVCHIGLSNVTAAQVAGGRGICDIANCFDIFSERR
jgi:hypothetical protein